ncbi:MAG TPA: Stk1 family PASTA domain-containing Ser/Thr kinase [Acidimicrobiales bacterium]|nr:Stk1 family PASTA domain-containing Ser/Thr kinase [Acidimicrobiales bacterium]
MASEEQRIFNGRYELHRRIARGGMADVFLARDSLLDRPVAVKVLFPEFATDPTFVQRFRREAQAAANLSHPNIVSVYDWGEEGGTYFIVMEYIEGRSLAQTIKDEGRLHPDRAADIATDVAAALGFAHRNGVVHRDIKPGNVLISPSGQVKVADFGIARAVSHQENLTQAGTVMGTATYFSPEQARGEAVDPRSDVYSLGVVLYEMVTGRPPFQGESPVAVAYKHVQETPAPPRSRNPDVPAALEAVVLQAMAKETSDRYPSAEDMRADLRRFREGREVQAAVVAPAGDTATRAVSPVAAAAGGAAAAAAGAGTTRAVPVVEETRTTTRPPEERYVEPPRRNNTAFIVVLVVLLAVLAGLLVLLATSLGLGDDSPAQVEVPGVVDLPQDEAERVLAERGLTLGDVTTEPNDEVEGGIVLRQDPAAGTEVAEGDPVNLAVSAGAEPVEVPRLEGLTRLEAEGRLDTRNLRGDFREQPSTEVEAGRIISSQPEAGATVEAGSVVVVTISSGPPQVAVPSVVGFSQEQAINTLLDAGFRPQVVQEPANQATGLVVSTDPAPNTQAPEGSRVTVVVSSGPPPTTTTLPPTTTTTTRNTTTTSLPSPPNTQGGGASG